ncbi:MAG: ComEC/Rec2 family competence protein [bacterium]
MDKKFTLTLIGFLLGTAVGSVAGAWFGLLAVVGGLLPKRFRWLALGVAIGLIKAVITLPVVDYLPPLGKNVALTGIVVNEVAVRDNYQQFNLETAGFAKPLLVSASMYPAVSYGQRWKGEGKLVDDRFRKGMAGTPIGLFKAKTVTTVDTNDLSIIQQGLKQLLSFKSYLISLTNQLWPEPSSSLVAGILWGGRASLDKKVQTDFQLAGVSHTLAVSGYNVTILLAGIASVLPWLGINRKQNVPVLLSILFCFVLITGASAAVVRAGIMGSIAVLGKQLGRPMAIGRVLLVTASVMAILNPFVLIYDVGFQLSFLATVGLVYITPLLEPHLTRLPEYFGLKENLTSTLSATIATLPVIVFNFGLISLVAPLANILILWSIPYTMALSAIAIAGGMVWLPLGKIIAWPSLFLLKYVVWIISWCAGLPYAYIDVNKL